MSGPREATLAVTYRCNSRCVMCNIWKCESGEELPPAEYRKLPKSLRTVNVTGGEPFMRKDLVDIVKSIHDASRNCRIVISTNGMLTSKILDDVSRIRKFHERIGLGISVDGIGEIHDKVRGVKGGFEKAIETVEGLKRIPITDLRLGMTLLDENSDQLLRVYELSKELGVEFTTTVAHNSAIYFRKSDNEPGRITDRLSRDLRTLECEHLRSSAVKDWFRAYHLEGIRDQSIRRTSRRKCMAGSSFFFMDPTGKVYPCIVLDEPMGNIRDFDSFDALFSSKVASEVRAKVRTCQKDCWMVCNIRTLLMSHPGPPIVWVIRNKPKAHFLKNS